MIRTARFALIAVLMAATLAPSPIQAAPASAFPPQVVVDVYQPPSPMMAAGKAYLVYELYITNGQSAPLQLTEMRVAGGGGASDAAFDFKGQALADMMHPVGVVGTPSDPSVLGPGARTIVFMWLPFDKLPLVPDTLLHTLTFETAETSVQPLAIDAAPVTVSTAQPVVIGPPLRGDRWVALNAPSNASPHRRAHMVLNGRAYYPQRYAIDYLQIGEGGLSYKGDQSRNESYYCYDADVLAVADGRVVVVKDGIPNNVPRAGTRSVVMTPDTAMGNYLVIDIGYGRYACYAHLIPGSIMVRQGDRVTRGQVVAKLGNTGNSTEPHLHFQVIDGPSFLASNGVPYAFDEFFVRSMKIAGDPAGGGLGMPALDIDMASPPERRTNELVLENTVMKFSDR